MTTWDSPNKIFFDDDELENLISSNESFDFMSYNRGPSAVREKMPHESEKYACTLVSSVCPGSSALSSTSHVYVGLPKGSIHAKEFVPRQTSTLPPHQQMSRGTEILSVPDFSDDSRPPTYDTDYSRSGIPVVPVLGLPMTSHSLISHVTTAMASRVPVLGRQSMISTRPHMTTTTMTGSVQRPQCTRVTVSNYRTITSGPTPISSNTTPGYRNTNRVFGQEVQSSSHGFCVVQPTSLTTWHTEQDSQSPLVPRSATPGLTESSVRTEEFVSQQSHGAVQLQATGYDSDLDLAGTAMASDIGKL